MPHAAPPDLTGFIDDDATIPIPEQDQAILSAIARVEASLRIVLAKIAEIKAGMNTTEPPTTWAGTP